MKRDEITLEERGPSRLLPVISGAYGGATVDFRRFAAEGITLLGRVTAARDGVLEIAPDLAESLAQGDLVYTTFLDMVDTSSGNAAWIVPMMRRRVWPCPIRLA